MKCTRCNRPRDQFDRKLCTRCCLQHAKWRQNLKRKIFEAYGGPRCVCCGEDYEPFLTIDHRDGRGYEHRAKGLTGEKWYKYLKRNNFPYKENLQVMCANCNTAKASHRNVCPCAERRVSVDSPS